MAKLAEQLGYDGVWLNAGALGGDPFVAFSFVAKATSKIKMGIGIVEPYTRHPAVIASSIAHLSAATDRELILGIGCSRSETLERVGMGWGGRGTRRIKESIEIIKPLLEGKVVDYDGKIFKMDKAQLRVKPKRPIPVIASGQGPNMMKMASKVADGLLRSKKAYDFDRESLASYHNYLKAAGRKATDIVMQLPVCVAEKRDEAINQLRPIVADRLLHADELVTNTSGIDHETALRYKEKPETLPDKYVEMFSVVGTVDDCKEQLNELESTGVTEIYLWYPIRASSDVQVATVTPLIERVGTDLLPAL